MAPDARLANPTLLRMAAWSLARKRGQRQPDVACTWMDEPWLRDLFTLMDAGGHLERICTETLHWTPAQIAEGRQWVVQRPSA